MTKGISIKWKVMITAVVAMSLLTVMIVCIGYYNFRDSVLESYMKYADTAVKSADDVFEKYKMGDMIARREMGEEYEKARLELNKIKNNADIKYLYAVYFEDVSDIHSLHYAINAKSDEELSRGLSAGKSIEEIYSYMGRSYSPDEFDDGSLRAFQACVLNKQTEPDFHESDTPEYGHLISCYSAIFDSGGNAVGVTGIDIEVNEINRDLSAYLLNVAIAAVIFTAVCILIFVYITNRSVIRPVKEIAAGTDGFVKLMEGHAAPDELVYKGADVRSGDEIFLLSQNVESLAGGVKSYMENLNAITAEKERISAELSVASAIQESQLPSSFPAFPERNEFSIFASMTPAKEVGGDFYDFYFTDDDHICMVIADVSGKGVPASLFMMISRILIKNRLKGGDSPGEALENVNRQICEGNSLGYFVTVWLAVLDISTGKGTAANAGHEHPALYRSDGRYELVKYKHSMAVGVFEDAVFSEHEFKMEPGDSLFVYTDGVAEAVNIGNEQFGTDRMLDALNREPGAEPDIILENVMDGINEFTAGTEQFDDITMLCFKYYGNLIRA